MGNGPPTTAPQPAAPAAAPPPLLLGPTPECPCMTTPSPNTTPQPGSPDDAKKDIEKGIGEYSKENEANALKVAEETGAQQVDEVNKLPGEAGELARAKLSKVGDKELDSVKHRLQEEADRDELRMDALRAAAKEKGKQNAEDVTQATEEVADMKARTVMGNVLAGTHAEIDAAETRAVKISIEAKDMVHEAKLSAEKVENAAMEAKMAALKEPRERVAEAARQSIKTGEKVMELQPEALQSQKIAEAAAAVAWEAKQTADKALADAKAAVTASEHAYHDALANKDKLVKLKARAKEASKEIKVAQASVVNAEQQATAAITEMKEQGYSTS